MTEKNMYFKEDYVRPLVLEYQALPEETRQTTEPGKSLREKIMIEVAKIVRGEIFTHKFTMWMDFDDLEQEALMACMKAIDKFNPNYISSVTGLPATCFNYFSLTTKRCLKYLTLRDKKNRDINPIDDEKFCVDRANRYEDMVATGITDILENLNRIRLHEKYIPIKKLFEIYLEKGKRYNKREFFLFARCFNFTGNNTRHFLQELTKNKEVFYDQVEENKEGLYETKVSNTNWED